MLEILQQVDKFTEWIAEAEEPATGTFVEITALANCFDNPPLRP